MYANILCFQTPFNIHFLVETYVDIINNYYFCTVYIYSSRQARSLAAAAVSQTGNTRVVNLILDGTLF